MEALGQHLMCRLVDDRVIAPTPEHRAAIARIILEQCRGYRLLAFNAADTHLHLEIAESRATSGRLARRIEITITRRLGLEVGFSPPLFKPILSHAHLAHTFQYLMRQQPRHGLNWDPFWEATNLPDLLGLRLLGRYTAVNVRELLPRVRRADLLGHLGLAELEPASGPLEHLVPAMVSAAGLIDARGRGPELEAARRAALAVIGEKLPLVHAAALLGTTRQTLHRMKQRPPDPSLVQAIRLQLGLRRQRRDPPHGAYADVEASPP